MLSLDEMSIEVVIDNGYAKVKVRQIFANHTGAAAGRQLRLCAARARRSFPISPIWDDATRIPGVILERKRAEEIYQRHPHAGARPGPAANGRARRR